MQSKINRALVALEQLNLLADYEVRRSQGSSFARDVRAYLREAIEALTQPTDPGVALPTLEHEYVPVAFHSRPDGDVVIVFDAKSKTKMLLLREKE